MSVNTQRTTCEVHNAEWCDPCNFPPPEPAKPTRQVAATVETDQELVRATQEKPRESGKLATREDGSLALRTLSDQLGFAQDLIRQGMVSASFKTAAQVVIALQYAKALRMPEMLAIRLMYVVNGRPCLYGDGPLALCQRSGLVESVDEFFVDKDGKRISFESGNLSSEVFGAVCRIKRKNDPSWQEDYFTLHDLKLAGMNFDKYGNVKDVWAKYERLMMRFKARSIALKTKFADCIAGVPIAEHDFDFSPEFPEILGRSGRSGAAELEARLQGTQSD